MTISKATRRKHLNELIRLELHEAQVVRRALIDARNSLAERLRANPNLWQGRQYEELINTTIDDLDRVWKDDFDAIAEGAIRLGLNEGVSLVDEDLPPEATINVQGFEPVIDLAALSMERSEYITDITKVTEELKERIFRETKASFALGMGVSDTMDKILGTGLRGSVGRDGVFRRAGWRAEMIARSTTNDMVNWGKESSFAQVSREFEELRVRKQWDNIGDGRTSDVCSYLMGQVRELDEEFTSPYGNFMRPSAHVNCRSTIIPVTEIVKIPQILAARPPEDPKTFSDSSLPATLRSVNDLEKVLQSAPTKQEGLDQSLLEFQRLYSQATTLNEREALRDWAEKTYVGNLSTPTTRMQRRTGKVEDIREIDLLGVHYEVSVNSPLNEERFVNFLIERSQSVDTLHRDFDKLVQNIQFLSNRNIDDASWAVEFNKPNFFSAATAGPNSITFYQPNPRVSVRWRKPEDDFKTYVHEIGHKVSAHRYGSPQPGRAWKTAVARDGPSPTDYGKVHIVEDYAESFKLHMLKDPAMIQHPTRVAVLEQDIAQFLQSVQAQQDQQRNVPQMDPRAPSENVENIFAEKGLDAALEAWRKERLNIFDDRRAEVGAADERPWITDNLLGISSRVRGSNLDPAGDPSSTRSLVNLDLTFDKLVLRSLGEPKEILNTTLGARERYRQIKYHDIDMFVSEGQEQNFLEFLKRRELNHDMFPGNFDDIVDVIYFNGSLHRGSPNWIASAGKDRVTGQQILNYYNIPQARQKALEVYIHELGHAVATATRGSGFLGDDVDFHKAVKLDGEPLTWYGRTNIGEDYAETFMLSSIIPEYVQARSPHRHAVMLADRERLLLAMRRSDKTLSEDDSSSAATLGIIPRRIREDAAVYSNSAENIRKSIEESNDKKAAFEQQLRSWRADHEFLADSIRRKEEELEARYVESSFFRLRDAKDRMRSIDGTIKEQVLNLLSETQTQQVPQTGAVERFRTVRLFDTNYVVVEGEEERFADFIALRELNTDKIDRDIDRLFETVRFHKGRSTEEAYWRDKYGLPNATIKGDAGNGELNIYDVGQSTEDIFKTYAHEAGHAIHQAVRGATDVSKRGAYYKAVKADGEALTAYGKVSLDEDYAEAQMLLALDPERLKAESPNRYAAVLKDREQALKEIEAYKQGRRTRHRGQLLTQAQLKKINELLPSERKPAALDDVDDDLEALGLSFASSSLDEDETLDFSDIEQVKQPVDTLEDIFGVADDEPIKQPVDTLDDLFGTSEEEDEDDEPATLPRFVERVRSLIPKLPNPEVPKPQTLQQLTDKVRLSDDPEVLLEVLASWSKTDIMKEIKEIQSNLSEENLREYEGLDEDAEEEIESNIAQLKMMYEALEVWESRRLIKKDENFNRVSLWISGWSNGRRGDETIPEDRLNML